MGLLKSVARKRISHGHFMFVTMVLASKKNTLARFFKFFRRWRHVIPAKARESVFLWLKRSLKSTEGRSGSNQKWEREARSLSLFLKTTVKKEGSMSNTKNKPQGENKCIDVLGSGLAVQEMARLSHPAK